MYICKYTLISRFTGYKGGLGSFVSCDITFFDEKDLTLRGVTTLTNAV